MIEHLMAWLTLKADRRAVTAMEYGLIAALIAVAIVASVKLVGTNLALVFGSVSTTL